jgi:hypothetical protein
MGVKLVSLKPISLDQRSAKGQYWTPVQIKELGMYIFRPPKKSILVILVKRAVFFFFTMCIFTVFLYGIGTIQGFMDITQQIMLHLAIILGFSLAVGSIYGILLDLWFVFYEKNRRFLGGIGGYIGMGLFGAVIATAATFIVVVSRGNGI